MRADNQDRKLQKARYNKKCTAYAGIAPYPKESGKMKCGHQISPMDNKQLKTLLFQCAHSAKDQVIASDLQPDSQATAL